MNRATEALIVVFDSKCLLCNGWVQFLLKHDKAGLISFASMQGETGKKLLVDHGLPTENLDTLLVLQGATSWLHTEAILKVLTTLASPGNLRTLSGFAHQGFETPCIGLWLGTATAFSAGQRAACSPIPKCGIDSLTSNSVLTRFRPKNKKR